MTFSTNTVFTKDVLSDVKNNAHFARVLFEMGNKAEFKSEYKAAYDYFSEAAQIFTNTLGESHKETIKAQIALTDLMSYQFGNYRASLEIEENILPICEENFLDSKILLDLYKSIASNTKTLELYEKELYYRKKIVDLSQKLNEKFSTVTMWAYGDLREVLHKLGKENEIKEMDREFLNSAENAVIELKNIDYKFKGYDNDNEDDLDIETQIDDLTEIVKGSIKQSRNSFPEETEKIEDKFINAISKIYGEDEYHTLREMEEIASERKGKKRIELLDKIIDIEKKSDDEDKNFSEMALIYIANSPKEVGETRARKTKEKLIKNLRKNHRNNEGDLADFLREESQIYNYVGEHKKAAECLKKVVKIYAKDYGENDERTLSAWDDLAVEFKELNMVDEAIDIYRKILSAYKSNIDSEYKEMPFSISAVNNYKYQIREYREILADYLQDTKHFKEELELRKKILDDFENYDSDLCDFMHSRIVAASDVAEALRNLQRYDEVANAQKLVVSLYNVKYGDESEPFINALKSLAGDYENMGNFDEALKIYRYVLNVSEKIFGDSHSKTIAVKNNIERVLNEGNQ